MLTNNVDMNFTSQTTENKSSADFDEEYTKDKNVSTECRQSRNKNKKSCKVSKKMKNENVEYTYNDFMNNTANLKDYYLADLKNIAKKLKLNTTAKKQTIIERINEHYEKVKSVILIQKIFRSFLVKTSFKLRGPAFHNRNVCVNDKDGHTLEPINEIPFERFYTLCDKNNFIYGFDVISLILSYYKNNKIINPFSRECISPFETNNILKLEKRIKILFPHVYDETELEEIYNTSPPVCPLANSRIIGTSRNMRRLYSSVHQQEEFNNHIRFTDDGYITNSYLPSFPPEVNNIIPSSNILTITSHIPLHDEELLNSMIRSDTLIQINLNTLASSSSHQLNYLTKKLKEIRTYPLQKRIDNLFIEIDLLGNYTSSSWFNNISNYYNFFKHLHTVWNYRVVLNINEKKKIYQLGDPFTPHTVYNIRNKTNNDIKEICVHIMENLVHGGIDEEYRKLGTYRVLMALTNIDLNARNTYSWLFDTIR